MKIGSTTIPLAGWVIDLRQPEAGRQARLAAMRQLVEGYQLQAIELSLDLGIVYPQVFDASFYAQVAELQQALGFTCTVHLPFLWVDPASMNELIRQASAACACRAAELVKPLQVETYVLHLWGSTTTQIATLLGRERPDQEQAILSAILVQAERSLAQICDCLEPRRLCIETLETPSIDFALPLVEKYGARLCLDVGHLQWQGGSELEFLARHGGSVGEVHLHDARQGASEGRRYAVDHLALGQGQVNYTAFLQRLRATGFTGAVILENNNRADLEQSLAKVREALAY